MRLTIGLVLGLLGLTLVTRPASAQSRFEAIPTFSVSQVYDDNLFAARSAPVADSFWRLSPRLAIRRRSPELTMYVDYGLAAEIYRQYPELNSGAASQEGALGIQWRPNRGLAAVAYASYSAAQNAGTLNTLTGLDVGRVDARRWSTTESLSRRFGMRTEAKLEYTFTREQVVGLPDLTTQSAAFGLERRQKGQGRTRLRYGVSQYAGAGTSLSQVVTLGLSAGLSRFAEFEIDAGPRRSGREVSPDVSVALSHRVRRGTFRVGYLHSRTTVVGYPAPVTADGVTATLQRHLGPISVSAVPSFFRVRSQVFETTLPRVGLDVAWHLTRDLALSVSNQFSLQRGGLNLAEALSPDMARNTILVGLVAKPPTR